MQSVAAIVLLGVLVSASAPRPVTPRPTPGEEPLERKADAFAKAGFAVTGRHEVSGLPTFTWVAAPASEGLDRSSATAAALDVLSRHARLNGISPEAIATARVVHVHDIGRGAIVVKLRQEVDGVWLHHHDAKVLLTRELEPVAIGGSLHPGARISSTHRWTLDSARAIARAFTEARRPLEASEITAAKPAEGGWLHHAAKTQGTFTRPARARRVLFPVGRELVAAWSVELFFPGERGEDGEALVVAADDGRVLERRSLVHDAFLYRVWAETDGLKRPFEGPHADFSPHPTGAPDRTKPQPTPPSLVGIDGFNVHGDPWLPEGATVTRGNNVDAYTDDGAPDGFSPNDLRATTTAPGVFDHVYDMSLEPTDNDEQRMAAVTQLFYSANWLHDYWYDSGFDEAAGNAQDDNYGRGGLGADVLLAEAQDGTAIGQRNNANMLVPADGASPRMQMFIWVAEDQARLEVDGLEPPRVSVAAFGPTNFDVSGALVVADDGQGRTDDACEPLGEEVSGSIVLIRRGTCTFKLKALHAQQAGAVGIVIFDNEERRRPPFLGDGEPETEIRIPALSVTREGGAVLRQRLVSGAPNARLHRVREPERDADLDTTIVAHEWGHMLHMRLVDCMTHMCGAMSEGIADFIAMHLIVSEGDDLNGAFVQGHYANAGGHADPAYFGVRRYPYSLSRARSPLTFRHVENGVALPEDVPTAPTFAPNAEIHNAGEVFASMLFEMFGALIERSRGPEPPYDFEGARRRMADLLVAGLVLAPANPTFLEQRDAIIAAATATDPSDLDGVVRAFASRGAGSCAVSASRGSSNFSGTQESLDVVPHVASLSVELVDDLRSCDDDGVLDAEERGELKVTVFNAGAAPLEGATVTLNNVPPELLLTTTTFAFDTIPPFSTGVARLPVHVSPLLDTRSSLALSLHVETPGACETTHVVTLRAPLNHDELPEGATHDDVETLVTTWSVIGNDGEEVWHRRTLDDDNRVWSGRNLNRPTDTALVSPPLEVSASEPFSVTFAHRYSFEESQGRTWDGGVVEVSTDGGETWEDVLEYVPASYSGTIPGGEGATVLSGRRAYGGRNPRWPAFDTEVLDFGTQLAGKTVRLRFRIVTDEATGAPGWDLDDFDFTGLVNAPFPVVADDASTCNVPPVADAGPAQTVTSGTRVQLSAAGTSDLDGDPLAIQWTQLKGPKVSLRGASTILASFVAPEVDGPTKLVFQVRAADRMSASTDTVEITVEPAGCGCAGAGVSNVLALLALAFVSRRRVNPRARDRAGL